MIIAELGSVHDGSVGNALKLIDFVSECKADFVKFQMHIADEESLRDAPSPKYFKDETRYEYFKRLEFTDTQWRRIINHCKKKKISFMCSIFSHAALKKLINLGVRNIKIPSGEVNNLPLLKETNNYKNLKIFLSTGMSDWKDINLALKNLNNKNIVLIQCTSIYPCLNSKVGLNIISEMKKKYKKKYKYGFSDHSIGSEAAICSLVYGAEYIEKHITFSKRMYGSDAKFAMEPNEFANFCISINRTKKMINSKINKNNLNSLKKMKKIFEKKIIAKKKITKGKKIQLSDLSFKKAKGGVVVSKLNQYIGKKIKKTILKNEKINLSNILS